jgi:magnesium chelatase family protein
VLLSGSPESGKTLLARAAGALSFPANFMLIAAMYPCPCGYHADPRRACACAAETASHFQMK